MRKLLLATILSLLSVSASAATTAQQAQLGFLSSATTGSSGCTTLGLGNPPCFVPYSATNPLNILTTGGSSISLTTSGTSGASTLVGSVLNIPVYSSGGGSTSLSAITSATGTNSIDNTLFGQTWNWSTLTTQTALKLTASSATTGVVLQSQGTTLLGLGSVSTSATTGFPYMATVAGVPIGIPSTQSGYVPYVYDTTDNRLYIYNSGWSNVGTAISSLVGATGTNSFDNANFNQTWTWNTLTTQTAMSITSTTVTTGSLLTLTATAGTTGPTLNVTGNAAISGTTTVNNIIVTGTCTGCGGGGGGSPGGSVLQMQYQVNGTTFGGTSHLYYSTTSGALNFANTTTGNALSQPVAGTDTTSLAIGPSALFAQTATGSSNTAVGVGALATVTTGTHQTAVGFNALNLNVVSADSTAVGYNALAKAVGTTGVGANTAVGSAAGQNITIGFFNTAIGAGALAAAQSTQSDTAVGQGALAIDNTAGSTGNTAVGSGAGNAVNGGTLNTLIGVNVVGSALANGGSNTIVGANATVPVASSSQAVGVGASVKPGSRDVAVGYQALASTTTNTNENTGVGYQALNAVTSSAGSVQLNLALGYQAGNKITTGTNNIAIGGLAATTTLATGSYNTLIGGLADTTTPGASHEFHLHDASLAAGTDAVTISGMGTNTTESVTIHGNLFLSDVGTDATKTDSTLCQDSTTHQLYFGSGTLGVCLGTSSIRFKTDIVNIKEGLETVMSLNPVNFRYKERKYGDTNKIQYGFIAEEAEISIPNLVGKDKEGHPNTFDYVGLIPVLTKAIQDQQKEISALSGDRKHILVVGHKCFFGLLVCAD